MSLESDEISSFLSSSSDQSPLSEGVDIWSIAYFNKNNLPSILNFFVGMSTVVLPTLNNIKTLKISDMKICKDAISKIRRQIAINEDLPYFWEERRVAEIFGLS